MKEKALGVFATLLGAICAVLAIVTIASCGKSSSAEPPPAPAAQARSAYRDLRRAHVPALTAVGALAFADPSLSADGTLACASCHDPLHAFSPAGRDPSRGRATPSLRYLQTVPRYTDHYSEGETGADNGPTGGFTWDGRAQSAHDQARLPLFSPLEMNNASVAALATRIRNSAWGGKLSEAVERRLVADEELVDTLVLAFEVYEQSEPFRPFSSKYDAYLRGTQALSAQEQRGLALFESETKGDCARCHPSRGLEGGMPLFSDWGYAALGVGDASDRGLCGPFRTDLANRPETCGMFRVPSLRNTARRTRWFHDGSVTSLRDVVKFYAHPEKRQAPNLEPLATKLTEKEIDDVVAFLKTLDDAS